MSAAQFLFRQEVIKKQLRQRDGQIHLSRANYTSVLLCAALAIVIPVVVFIAFGSYTKRTAISGVTSPDLGLLKIVPNPPGTIATIHVFDGHLVKKGQLLYTIRDERRMRERIGQNQIDENLRQNSATKKKTITENIQLARSALSRHESDYMARISSIESQFQFGKTELEIIRERLAKAKSDVAKYERLAKNLYVTDDAVKDRLDAVALLRTQEVSNYRQALELQRMLATAKQEKEDGVFKFKTQLNELSIQLNSVERENIEDEVRSEYSIVAPEDGVVSATAAYVGQVVGGKPIAMLMPASAEMQIHLYANSKAVGFVKPGQLVKLRYQAFPFQKYGQFEGVVKNISLVPIDAGELPIEQQATHEDKYRLVVTPEKREFLIDGEKRRLIPGMMVDANVYQETRRLYQWMFDPLKIIFHTL
ncbi:HlyD family secretion protein [Variovorax sp. GB1R11]|uniref:HlyD family secretion protein n=1 Tax=Variovorax sp. GB1R11 TaxID=3443741 RepID=UPI003F473909